MASACFSGGKNNEAGAKARLRWHRLGIAMHSKSCDVISCAEALAASW
jgi:hypothetical protein